MLSHIYSLGALWHYLLYSQALRIFFLKGNLDRSVFYEETQLF